MGCCLMIDLAVPGRQNTTPRRKPVRYFRPTQWVPSWLTPTSTSKELKNRVPARMKFVKAQARECGRLNLLLVRDLRTAGNPILALEGTMFPVSFQSTVLFL